MVGTTVCVAASIAGDMSQDLKTGYVLGQTPRLQQIGEMIGVLTSAGVVAVVVMMLHRTTPGGLGGPELPAPQAMLMRLVIDGVLDQSLPWVLVLIGVGIGLAVWLAKLPVLPFAVGVYLPLETMAAVFLGGLLRWWLTRGQAAEAGERRREEGVLFGAGLVGGGGLTGVLLAAWVGARGGVPIRGIPLEWPEPVQQVVALAGIAAILGLLTWHVRRAAR
jgi:putative OPT family oligopeptide transporter